jgi:adenylate kinase family enzyme
MAEPFKVVENWSESLVLPGAHAIFAGGSGSGKTTLALSLLQNRHVLSPRPKIVYFHYDTMQDAYLAAKQKLAVDGVELRLIKGMENVKLENYPKTSYQSLIIFDDLSLETASSQEVARMVTNARHSNLTVWLCWHFIYSKWAESRVISQNMPYIFLLPSPRLESQIAHLGSQLGLRKPLLEAYKQAASDKTNRYLLVDLHPLTPPTLRLRTAIQNTPQYIYT